MDITDTLAPKSDQLDAVDLSHSGPRTFTITDVSKGAPDQPVNVHLAEFPRVWRPGKSMRRVLASCWGTDASAYVGRRVTLFCDPTVKFGGEAVGGIRVSHMSHIDKPTKVPLIVTRGKSAMYTVRPLTESAPTPALDIATCTDQETLRLAYQTADAATRERIKARKAELDAAETLPIEGDQ